MTYREREILDLLMAGKSSKMIAAELRIRSRAVDVHRARILEKVGTANVAELVQRAMLWRAGSADCLPFAPDGSRAQSSLGA